EDFVGGLHQAGVQLERALGLDEVGQLAHGVDVGPLKVALAEDAEAFARGALEPLARRFGLAEERGAEGLEGRRVREAGQLDMTELLEVLSVEPLDEAARIDHEL